MNTIFQTLCLLILSSLSLFSQGGNLVVFSEDADRFYVLLNGVHQNKEPQSNVKIINLPMGQYKIKVIFQDNSLAPQEKMGYVEGNQEFSFNIKRDKKGVLVMKLFSVVPATSQILSGQFLVDYGQPSQTSQNVVQNNVNTNQSSNAVYQNTNQQNSNQTNPVQSNVSVQTQTNGIQNTNTVQTNTQMGSGSVGFNMNVNVNENGMNVNVNGIGDPNLSQQQQVNTQINTGQPQMNSSYQQTTTVTTTRTVNGQVVEQNSNTTYNNASNGGVNVQMNTQNNQNTQNWNQNNQQQMNTNQQNVTTNGCFTMYDSDFTNFTNSMKSKGFEDTKLTLAKQIIAKQCLSAAQIKTVMSLFGFEETRLDFAKLAYKRCSDPLNYYMVNDAFQFESSIEELNEYIEKQ